MGASQRMIGERCLAKDDWRRLFSKGGNPKDRLSKHRLSKHRCWWSLIINIRAHYNFSLCIFSLENFRERLRDCSFLFFSLFVQFLREITCSIHKSCNQRRFYCFCSFTHIQLASSMGRKIRKAMFCKA